MHRLYDELYDHGKSYTGVDQYADALSDLQWDELQLYTDERHDGYDVCVDARGGRRYQPSHRQWIGQYQ